MAEYTERADILWSQVLEVMQGEVSKPSYETWFRNTEGVKVRGHTIVVKTPHDIGRKFLADNYRNEILRTLRAITGTDMEVSYVSGDPSLAEVPVINEQAHFSTLLGDEVYITRLNPKYTFDTFVVGNSNRFAHAASLAVAEAPARAYNPLFIYGGVGLGKTHLMQAVGHYAIEHNPGSKVVYVSSEKFTNDLINAIGKKAMVEFRDRYRNVDVLLVDDIQFVAGKESTQEEFFHTFNALYESNKQIVMSSDRPPKEIPTLEERLRSRFEWGLTTDIQPPDLETRIAILRKKAATEHLEIPEEVLSYIANRIHSNIRELEGALNRVVAVASLSRRDITVETAEEALKDIVGSHRQKQITIDTIQNVVANHYSIKVAEMKSKKRTRAVTFPRQVAMYLSRDLTDASLPRIGEEFGGRDHTTVLHACDKIQRLLQKNPTLQREISELTQELQNS